MGHVLAATKRWKLDGVIYRHIYYRRINAEQDAREMHRI